MDDWNQYLYSFARQRGGQYMGSAQEQDDGIALLTDRQGETMVLDCTYRPVGRYANCYARLRLTARLNRPYSLTIRPKGIFSTGAGAVLGALDHGLDKLPNAPDLTEDYGYPEVTRGRFISTEDKEFTRIAIRDLALRNALKVQPKFGVSVSPALPEPEQGELHVIEIYAKNGFAAADSFTRLNYLEKLEGMLALGQAVKDAVTAYRI